MLNQITLVGSLGDDAESRVMKNGNKVVNFSMATNESYKDKTTGEYKDKTTWHKIVIFNPAKVNFAEKVCRKGSLVLVQGQNSTRSYEDKEGRKVYVTEVIVPAYSGNFELLNRPKDSSNTAVTMNQKDTFAQAAKDDLDDFGKNGDKPEPIIV